MGNSFSVPRRDRSAVPTSSGFLEHTLKHLTGQIFVVLEPAGIHWLQDRQAFVAGHERLSVFGVTAALCTSVETNCVDLRQTQRAGELLPA